MTLQSRSSHTEPECSIGEYIPSLSYPVALVLNARLLFSSDVLYNGR